MDLAAEFPGLSRSTYLNSCAHGLLPKRARRAMEAHLDRWEGEPDWAEWGQVVERARVAFARFIGARDDEVAVQANATSGMAAVMNTVTRGRIVTLDVDFPTAGFLAQRQTARSGVQHDHARSGPPTPESWAKHARGAALATLPAVVSFSGHKLDVPAFVERAKAMDVPLLVDAFQACGTYPIDVRKWDVDFLVTGVYKWTLAPAGLAFLYVRRDHHARVPTTSGWYAAANGSMDPLAEMWPDARRYQYGGPSVLSCAALPESLAVLEEKGLSAVEAHNAKLVERVIEHCRARKLELLTPEEPERRASIVTFRVPHLERALAECQREKVVVNTRLGGIRVSPHLYNTRADVDRLFDVLDHAA